MRVVYAVLIAAAVGASACRAPRRPEPPPPPPPNLDGGLLRFEDPRELLPYLETYPLGELGRRKDLLAATSERSMHLVQLALPLPPHIHPTRTEIAYVLTGTGTVYVGDRSYPAAPGATFRIEPNRVHWVVPDDGQTVNAIVFYEPPLLGDDDAVVVDPND